MPRKRTPGCFASRIRIPNEDFDKDIPTDTVKGCLYGRKVFLGELLARQSMTSDLHLRDGVAKYKGILFYHFAKFVYTRRKKPHSINSELRASL